MSNEKRNDNNEAPSAYGGILRLFVARDYTEFQIREKMKRRDVQEKEQDEIIERLREEGAIDDARFTRHFIDTTIRKRSVGPSLIALHLKRRGVAPELIDAQLEALYSRELEREIIDDVLRKRNARSCEERSTKQPNRTSKDARFLYNRGFHNDIIQDALNGSG